MTSSFYVLLIQDPLINDWTPMKSSLAPCASQLAPDFVFSNLTPQPPHITQHLSSISNLLDDLTIIHLDYSISLLCDSGIMGDDNVGLAELFVELTKKLHYLF